MCGGARLGKGGGERLGKERKKKCGVLKELWRGKGTKTLGKMSRRQCGNCLDTAVSENLSTEPWFAWNTLIYLLQARGRGMRNICVGMCRGGQHGMKRRIEMSRAMHEGISRRREGGRDA